MSRAREYQDLLDLFDQIETAIKEDQYELALDLIGELKQKILEL